MDKLLARLCENRDQAPGHHDLLDGTTATCNSLPVTPATNSFVGNGLGTRPASAAPSEHAASEEVLRLKLELAKAQSHISKVEHELAQTRRDQQDSNLSTPVPSSASEFVGKVGAHLTVEPMGIKPLVNSAEPSCPRTQDPRDNNWQAPVSDDCRSDISEAVLASGFNKYRGIWNNGNKPFSYHNTFIPPPIHMQDAGPAPSWPHSRNQSFMDQSINPYPGPPMDGGFRGDRYSFEPDLMRSNSGRRGKWYDSRFNNQSFANGYGSFNTGNIGQSQYDSTPNYAVNGSGNLASDSGMGVFQQYAPQAAGAPLSPHATEFTSAAVPSWKPDVSFPSVLLSLHIGMAFPLIIITSYCLACFL